MARSFYILAVFAALSAWAGAQGPSAADQLRLLKTNSTLIENLVDHGVALSAASDPVERAEQCRFAARSLSNAIQNAATANEAERVAELLGLFRDVVRDGLKPTLDAAEEMLRTAPPESPARIRLKKLRETAAADVRDLRAAIPTTGKIVASARVKDALKQLDELKVE